MTYTSFRQLRAAGMRPCDAMEAEQLMWFAERATTLNRRPPNPAHLQLVREVGDQFDIEIATDPDIRSWFLDSLSADLRAIAEMEQQAEECPFPLEASDGNYSCSSCGNEATGRHLAVIDRNQWLADYQQHLQFCLDCVRAATG